MTEIVRLDSVESSLTAGIPARGGVVTIGNFDGVHRGHAALLGEVRAIARERLVPSAAIVLDPHPASLLRPDRAPTRLTTIPQRAERMDRLGIDVMVVCRTTHALLQMTAREFFQALVIDQINAVAMVEGPNFFFGRDRGGDVNVLRELCQKNRIDLHIVDPTTKDGGMISSTRVRSLVQAGDVQQAARLLGTPHQIIGRVGSGSRRGREIGFPTANLVDIEVVIPAPGVYGGQVQLGDQVHIAAIHIGPNPTFERDGEVKVEIHLLDFDGDLYEKTLTVDVLTRVRDIARFDSVERLIAQLETDIATIRSRLARRC